MLRSGSLYILVAYIAGLYAVAWAHLANRLNDAQLYFYVSVVSLIAIAAFVLFLWRSLRQRLHPRSKPTREHGNGEQLRR